MEVYQKMYTTLFNAVTDALEKIEAQNYGDAKDLLIAAQQQAEDIYILDSRINMTRLVPQLRVLHKSQPA